MSDYGEVIEERGNYRARLVPDPFAEAPFHDEQGYVFLVDRWVTLEHKDHGDPEPSFDLSRVHRHYGWDWDRVERYLRIFHDVVGFDRVSLSGGDEYVCIVTRAQRDAWGCTDDADLTGDTLEMWRAYAEGDRWGAVIEERTVTETRTLDERVLGTEESWTVVDSRWGYYGDEYARQEALDMLSYLADKPSATMGK